MTAYERLLTTINKRKTPQERTTCCCGKEIFVRQLEKHQKTALHALLMFKKEQGELTPSKK